MLIKENWGKLQEMPCSFGRFDIYSAELRDGHVNLSAAHNVSRYGRWFDDYPMNQSDSLERIYLGRAEDYQQAGGLKYRILKNNVGYVRCTTFEYNFGDGNLQEMMRYLATCDRLVIDVRSNGGGMLTAAEKLASLFINEETVVGYMCHKTGKAHDAFSACFTLHTYMRPAAYILTEIINIFIL